MQRRKLTLEKGHGKWMPLQQHLCLDHPFVPFHHQLEWNQRSVGRRVSIEVSKIKLRVINEVWSCFNMPVDYNSKFKNICFIEHVFSVIYEPKPRSDCYHYLIYLFVYLHQFY